VPSRLPRHHTLFEWFAIVSGCDVVIRRRVIDSNRDHIAGLQLAVEVEEREISRVFCNLIVIDQTRLERSGGLVAPMSLPLFKAGDGQVCRSGQPRCRSCTVSLLEIDQDALARWLDPTC
jgi:hypothetical protein